MNESLLPTPIAVGIAAAVAVALLFGPAVVAGRHRRPQEVDDGAVAELCDLARPPVGRSFRSLQRLLRRRSDRGPVPPDVVSVWCDALAHRSRTGESLRQTLLHEHPTNRVLDMRTEPMRLSLQRGSALIDAIRTTPGSPAVSDPHLDLLRSVLAAIADFGGSAAIPIDRVGATLRLRSVDGQERSAQSAQAKLSANVLTVVPLGLLIFLVAVDRDVRAMVGSGIGATVVISGLVLNLAGWYWMKRTIVGDAP